MNGILWIIGGIFFVAALTLYPIWKSIQQDKANPPPKIPSEKLKDWDKDGWED
tara:strand:+ start:20887 stop:21045 length:159 start_codon:yes stop_codon:yes gene_type:complete